MNLQARPYRDPIDMATMRQLLVSGIQANIPASYMPPGMLDWVTYYPPDEQANRRNLCLWEQPSDDGPALAAWSLFFPHEGSFDLFVHPALHGTEIHETVMDEFVAWAETRAREEALKRIWPFWAMTEDSVLVALMQSHGYVIEQVDPAPPLFERALDTLPTIPLPDGFTVQGVQNLDDGKLRASVTHGAFRPNDNWDEYWGRYSQFIGSAVYEGERDLFVRAPDGRGAAACTLWFDHANGIGLFEPVATHPDFQRQGLGKAVMAEGMRRMKAAGMQRAILGFDPQNLPARLLYTAMGFQPSAYFVVAHKPL